MERLLRLIKMEIKEVKKEGLQPNAEHIFNKFVEAGYTPAEVTNAMITTHEF